jgi:DNA repair protein RadC
MNQMNLLETEVRKPSRAYSASLYKVVCLRETPAPESLVICDDPERAATYWREIIAKDPNFNGDVESLYVLHLNSRKRITGHHLVAQGTLDTILAHPREVFRAAIVANAGAIVIMHNHPSGDSSPSEADIRVTRELIRAGQVLKMEVCDHVIVGTMGRGFHSIRELGYFTA